MATPESDNHTGKLFSLGALKQRASGAFGGSSSRQKRRPASMMNISVVREDEGGVPSGVKMDLVPLDQAPPPLQNWLAKKKRESINYSCSIHTDSSKDFNAAMEECKQTVLEAGGNILDLTYPGGFLYDMSFAKHPNPLDSLDQTAGGGHIIVEPYPAGMIPHPHPLRANPPRIRSGIATSILEHMHRFGLAENPHPCNGRDKPCLPSCRYHCTSNIRQRPESMMIFTRTEDMTAPVSSSPPRLEPTKRTSVIRMEDIFERAQAAFSPLRLKRNSINLSRMVEQDDTLTWLDDQETVKQFEKESSDGMKMERGKRARPTPIFGTVENNHYVANCRPPISRRSSSLKQTDRASSEAKNQMSRRDSIVTAVHQLSSPIIQPQTPLASVELHSPSSIGRPFRASTSPNNEPPSPMYSDLSSENILELQKRLTDIREGLSGR